MTDSMSSKDTYSQNNTSESSTVENSNLDLESQDLQQTLHDILESDDYSNKIEVEVPKPKEKPQSNGNDVNDDSGSSWLEDFFRWLFDGDSNNNGSGGSGEFELLNFLPALMKGLMIFALLLLIYWIVKNSDSIMSWINQRQWNINKPRVTVDDYRQSHLAQGWENLPPHNQIPTIVQQLLADGDILPAGSILYRGSLRWINDAKLVYIKPANTEGQCIDLMNHISSETKLPPQTKDYINTIIHQWMPIAYDNTLSNHDNQNIDKQSLDQQNHNEQRHRQNLSALANNWLEQLQTIQQYQSQVSQPNQTDFQEGE